MPTLDEIRLEKIRREKARRSGGAVQPATTAAQPAPQGGGDGLLYQIPGVGPYIKAGDEAFSKIFGRPPTPKETLQGFDDAARVAADTASRGFLDKALGPEAQKATLAARERLGGAAPVVDVAESLVEPTVASKIKLLEKGGRVVKAGANAVEGGVNAGLASYGHGTPLLSEKMAWDVAGGAGISGALSQLGGPVSKWMQRRKAKAEATYKTDADVKKAAKDKYKEVESSGAVYQARDLRRLHSTLKQMDLVPGTDDDAAIAMLNKLEKDWTGKDISPKDLDKVRQRIRQKVAATPNQKRIAGDMIDAMDAFTKKTPVYKPPPKGQQGPYAPAKSVDKTLEEARDLYGRRERLGLIQREENRAQRQAKSGRFNPFAPNLESARVKKFSKLSQDIEEGKSKSKFTPAETKGVKGLEEGTLKRNLGGAAEHLSFSGGMFPWMVNAAALAVPGVGTIAPAVSAGAEVLHRVGQHATSKEIEDLKALIRDPSGKGFKTDPATTQAAKDKLAKMMSAAYRGSLARREQGGPR